MLTADRIAEIKKRADEATEGPWEPCDFNEGTSHPALWGVVNPPYFNPLDHPDERAAEVQISVGCYEDAEFIAHARQDVPLLLEQIKKLTNELDSRDEEAYDKIKAQRDEAIAELAKLNNAVTWETNCLGCAQMLDAQVERDVALAEVEQLRGEAAETDRTLMQVIAERDERGEVADALAEAIAELTGVEIGEHSSANDPWRNALDAAAEQGAEVERLKVQASNYAYQRDEARRERDEIHRKHVQLLETWERQQSVVEAAKAWREEQSASIYLGTSAVGLELIAAVDALDVTTPTDDDLSEPHFGHVSRADLASIAALGGHFPNPDVSFELVDDEQSCLRCGGLDGMHVQRNCPEEGGGEALSRRSPDAESAHAAGFAEAVAMLRDDTRYANWWSAVPPMPGKPTGRYWDATARGHLADYLETVKLPLPTAETSVEPCTAVSPRSGLPRDLLDAVAELAEPSAFPDTTQEG